MSLPDDGKLRTPQEWAALEDMQILDPDGWRTEEAPPFDAPCTRAEYLWRIGPCTVGPLNWGKK